MTNPEPTIDEINREFPDAEAFTHNGGADSIDDLDLLRHGALPVLFGGVRAPSTLGSFLRSFTWGNVLQLGQVSRLLLVELARQAPLLPGKETLAFLDIDSQQKRTLVVLGENGRAVEVADAIGGDRLRMLRKERRAALLVDTARACSQAGQRDEALRRLLIAEEIALPEVRCRPLAQATIADLLHRCQGTPPPTRADHHLHDRGG